MAYSKEIALGNAGKIVISEEAGVASVEVVAAESVGGGQAAGVLSVSASAKAQLDAKHLIDLGFELAKSKFPSAASLLDAAQAGIDAEIAKA